MFRGSSEQANQDSCTICLNPFDDPRVVGNCRHFFCLRCLERYVGQLNDVDRFMCPLCRQMCLVPNLGLNQLEVHIFEPSRRESVPDSSAIGLTAHPTEARSPTLKMADTLKQNTGKNGNEPPCSVCHDVGSAKYCKACHDIYICAKCAEVHGRNPLTKVHSLLGICTQHGKPLEFFCQKCNCGACSVCLIAQHAEHDVKSVFDMLATIGEGFSGLQGEVTETRSALDEHARVMADFLERGKKQFSAKIANKENKTKQQSADECQQLTQLQHDIATTRKRLDELLKHEDGLMKQHKKTLADSNAEVAEYKKEMTAAGAKTEALGQELADASKKLSNSFARCQMLLQKNMFSPEHIANSLTANTDVRNALVLAKTKVQASEKGKREMQPLIKEWCFFQRCSPFISIAEDNKAVSWNLTKKAFNPPAAPGVWSAQQQFNNEQYGLVMIQQAVKPGDEIEIEIEVKPRDNAGGATARGLSNPQRVGFYAGFTEKRPGDVDFGDVGRPNQGAYLSIRQHRDKKRNRNVPGQWRRSCDRCQNASCHKCGNTYWVSVSNGMSMVDFTDDAVRAHSSPFSFLAKRQPDSATFTLGNENAVYECSFEKADEDLYLCFILTNFTGCIIR